MVTPITREDNAAMEKERNIRSRRGCPRRATPRSRDLRPYVEEHR